MQEEALSALADRLSKAAGRGAVHGVERLLGGRNNQVFRVESAGGQPCVLKLYHADPRDTRDRLGQEWSFLSYAWDHGVRAVPEPLAREVESHAGLYSFVPGCKLRASEITAREVGAALEFVLDVNAQPRRFQDAPWGSEACFSLADHLATIDGRVARLERLDEQSPARDAAEALVRERLKPAWAAVKSEVIAGAHRLGLALEAPIEAQAVCLSPSDFGFHNALAQDGEITFIDFEYAGRDDPAKLACDFFCQPEVPIALEHQAAFIDGLVAGLDIPPIHAARCRLLLDAYRVKWACIILNDFLPLGSARRTFADHGRTAERCEAQLARARQSLAPIQIAA